MLRLANVDDWQISNDENNRKIRDAAYVIPPQASDSEIDSDSDPEMNIPLDKLAQRYRHERETSEDEDDIPLLELRKRLKSRALRQEQNEETEVKDMDCINELPSDNSHSLPLVEQSDSDSAMSVNEVHLQSVLPSMETLERVNTVKKRQRKSRDRKGDVKNLLSLISDLL